MADYTVSLDATHEGALDEVIRNKRGDTELAKAVTAQERTDWINETVKSYLNEPTRVSIREQRLRKAVGSLTEDEATLIINDRAGR